MPALWADLECGEQELSGRFFQMVAPYRSDFKGLGFTEVGLKKVNQGLTLNPIHRDNGGISFLDGSRCHFGQVIYIKTRVPAPINTDKEQVTISFTAVFQHRTLSYTNIKFSFDSCSEHEVVRCPASNVTTLYQHFIERLKRTSEQPKRFPDLHSLQNWFDSNAREVFEDRVRRGLFIRMSDDEVAVARLKLPPPIPNP